MILFWIICAVMLAIALAFVVPPFLQRGRSESKDASQQANVAVYRDQISELDADLRNGIISQEQHKQDRNEIERRLLEDVELANEVSGGETSPRLGRKPVYALALGIPLIAIAMYVRIAEPGAVTGRPAGAVQPPFAGGAPASGQRTQQDIEANVAALARRLEQNPGDAQGWIMLGRSYINLEKYADAATAYGKATTLKADDADLWADYAFAMGMANGRRLQGRPVEIINKALEIDPENPKALQLAGSAAFETNNYAEAIRHWQKLLRKTPPESELARELTQRINEAKSLGGTETR